MISCSLTVRGEYRVSVRSDSLAERSEFELPVPLSELSDNSLMLSFAPSRRVVKRSHLGLHLWRASGLSLKRTVPNWIALSGGAVAVLLMSHEEKLSLSVRHGNRRPGGSSGP